MNDDVNWKTIFLPYDVKANNAKEIHVYILYCIYSV